MIRSREPTRGGALKWSVLRLWLISGTLSCASGAAFATGTDSGSLAQRRAALTAPARQVSDLAVLSRRARHLEDGMRQLEARYGAEVEPLVHELSRHSGDGDLVHRVALALVREGNRAGVDPRLLLSVLLVEDPELETAAVSSEGAVGLMQVMPTHAGGWGCGSNDLTDPDANICHGARILAHYLAASGGDLDRALLRYNGCVRGSNTPDCHLYPVKVYRRASEAMFRVAQK
jgi:soluble lytic murein transglycosylase-like protein